MNNKHILATYYNTLADSLASKSKMAGITEHPGDTGSNREDLIKEFINKHTPDRLTCYLGGKIIGLNQPTSKQIDCMVTVDIAPKFEENERSIAVVESVAMAISIKSHLNKNTLFDSLDNLSTIPRISENIIKETSAIKNKDTFKDIEKRIPSLYVFSYSGIQPDTIMKHLHEYYQNNSSIPWNRRPKSILVNREYAIKYSVEEMPLKSGTIVPPYTYHSSYIKQVPGYALAEIIVDLSNIISWYNDLWLQFYHYLNEAYFT